MWGAFHALCFLPLLLMGKNRRFRNTVAEGRILPTVPDAARMLGTFALAVFGWIIFRANSIAEFADYCSSMVTNLSIHTPIEGKKALFFVLVMLIVEWVNRSKEHPFQIDIKSRTLRWCFYLLIALLCLTQAGQQVQFIYFQF